MTKTEQKNKYKMRSNYALFINPESAKSYYLFFDSDSYHLDHAYESNIGTNLYRINS